MPLVAAIARRFTIFAALCGFLCAAPPALAHRTTVFLGPDGAPRVRYEMAAGDDTLRFPRSDERVHAEVRVPWWKVDAKCFALDRASLRRLSADCPAPEIALEWDEKERDRMYPAVVKLRNGGVLVFAGYIQTLTRDGSAVDEIVIEAPPAGVAAFRGEKSRRSITLDSLTFADDARGWIYLGPDRFAEEGAARVLVDDGVPAAIRAEMVALAPEMIRIYSERLGAKLPELPTFYLTWAGREVPVRSWQADVVPGSVIRFTLIGEHWKSGAPELVVEFRGTIAHELAHLWNAGVFRPASWAASWLSEGGADLLGLAALVDAGKLESSAAAQRVAASFTECAVLAGTRAWIAIPERQAGRIPYVCGLAIQLGVVAVARRRDSSIDAFAFWKGLGASAAPYHEAAAVQFLQRSGAAEESALLGRMFTDKDTPFVESLRQLYAAAGLATRAGGALPARLRPAIAGKLLIAIMGEDCSGSYGFFRQDDYFLTQESKSCKSFGAPMKVRYVAGRDLLNAPFEAIAAAREACADAKSVTLRSVDGSEIAPACSEATLGGVATPESVIALEEAPVVAVLKASR